MIDHPPRVFISYSQESDEHSAWVLALANRLRAEGVEALIDRYFSWPEKGWRPWMNEQIELADWVLVVCTDEYRKRFDGNAAAGSGRGVRWESQHITQALYDAKFSNKRFVPVLPPAGDERFIPLPLQDYRSFRLDDQYDDLYRLLTDQPATPAPKVGKLRHLPPLPVPVPADADPALAAPDATSPQYVFNPYPGLAAFRPEDCRFFFGRADDTTRVLERLEQSRFVSVVGGSGTGKSSLVAAGVVPALRERKGRLIYLRFKPQADPFRQLAETLDRALPEERLPLGKARVERLMQELDSDPEKAVAKALAKLQAVLVPVMIFVDQFESCSRRRRPRPRKASARCSRRCAASRRSFCC